MCTKVYRVYGWKPKPKGQIEDEFIYIMNKSVRLHVKSVFNIQINNSETCLIYVLAEGDITRQGFRVTERSIFTQGS